MALIVTLTSLAALSALAAAQVTRAVISAPLEPDEEVFQSITMYGTGLLLSLAAGLIGIADALRRDALVWGAAIVVTVFVASWTVGFVVYFGSPLHPFVFSGLVPVTAHAYSLSRRR